MLKRLQHSEAAKWFMVPVDPVRHNAPKYVCPSQLRACLFPFSYLDVIKHPMDFFTMTNKLKSGEYASKEDLAVDVRLMCSNAYKYNQVPDAPAYLAAKEIEDLLDDRKWTSCRSLDDLNGEVIQCCARLTARPKNLRSRSRSSHLRHHLRHRHRHR